jgi:DNA-binding protein H-NS
MPYCIFCLNCDSKPVGRTTEITKATLSKLTVDQLWILHEEIRAELLSKMHAEKVQLESRLAEINRQGQGKPRRPYPKVLPKYRNPDDPCETWSGRGRRPHWVREQLKKGKKIEDLSV